MGPLFKNRPYDFGEAAGDSTFDAGYVRSARVALPHPLHFAGKPYDSLYVSLN